MTEQQEAVPPGGIAGVRDVHALAGLLRQLRRREARQRGDAQLTYRELAAKTGWSLGAISNYLSGRALAPTGRFDVLVQLLGATPAEQRALATARDRVEEHERGAGDRPPGRPIPNELPADVRGFTGRAAELARLDDLLRPGPPTPVAHGCLVSGTAGIGKTALAVRWAHRVRDAFPDGQLYVDLRGYDLYEPVSAPDALAGLLRSLGVAGQDIPADNDERAARYRSALHGRRVLVVLDNAATAEQIRPLLPGTPSCVTVVTSRDSLAGLVARHGLHRLDLDLPPMADAVRLVRTLIGPRPDADTAVLTTLARQCARLPLALRVAAEFAAAHPAETLTGLTGELVDEHRRLDLLDAGGDPRADVRAVFSWSWRHLPGDAARALRLIGLHPGADIDAYATAALTDLDRTRAGDLLGVLARAHLIHRSAPGRYGMHDLLRAYVAQLGAADEPADAVHGPGGRRTSLTRLFDYYLATAAAAMDAIRPAERGRRPRIPPPATPMPPVADPAAARAWLDAERATLVAVATHTAGHGWPAHTARLSTVVCRYLETGGHYTDAVTVHTSALRAARETGDPHAEAHALNNLGIVDGRLGRYPQAAGHLRQALALFRGAGDRCGEARTLANLGSGDWRQGRYPQANRGHRRALALFRRAGDRLGEARALNSLGLVAWRQGRDPRAADLFQRALSLYREFGDQSNEAHALSNLGMVHGRLGRCPSAARCLARALALCVEIGDRNGEATTRTDLGVLACRRRRYREAISHHQRALVLFREIGERTGETEALNGLGEVLLAIGAPGQARDRYAAALRLAGQTGDRHEQARARSGLARGRGSEGRLVEMVGF